MHATCFVLFMKSQQNITVQDQFTTYKTYIVNNVKRLRFTGITIIILVMLRVKKERLQYYYLLE